LKLGLLAAKAPNLRFTPEEPGTYVLTLEVVDRGGVASDPANFSVKVEGGKPITTAKAPTAVATLVGKNPSRWEKKCGISSEVRIRRWETDLQWSKVSGPALQAGARDDLPELAITPTAAGTFEFQLVVNNGAADSAPASVTFKVSAPPARRPSSPKFPRRWPGNVTLDGTGSTAATARILNIAGVSWKANRCASTSEKANSKC